MQENKINKFRTIVSEVLSFVGLQIYFIMFLNQIPWRVLHIAA